MFPGFIPPSDPRAEPPRPAQLDFDNDDTPASPIDLRVNTGQILLQMNIAGTEGMSADEIIDELRKGGRFVIYQYCISIFVLTILQNTHVHFLRAGQPASFYGSRFSGMSLLLGWWGIPWGPIRTIQSLITNTNGIDVTSAILDGLGLDLRQSMDRPPSRRQARRRAHNRKSQNPQHEDDYGMDQ